MPDDRKLCSLCIADGPLREWFEEHGTEDSCDFDQDHDSANCATVDEFAEEADRWFREHYQPGAETIEVDPDPESDRVYHGTEGEPFESIANQFVHMRGNANTSQRRLCRSISNPLLAAMQSFIDPRCSGTQMWMTEISSYCTATRL